MAIIFSDNLDIRVFDLSSQQSGVEEIDVYEEYDASQLATPDDRKLEATTGYGIAKYDVRRVGAGDNKASDRAEIFNGFEWVEYKPRNVINSSWLIFEANNRRRHTVLVNSDTRNYGAIREYEADENVIDVECGTPGTNTLTIDREATKGKCVITYKHSDAVYRGYNSDVMPDATLATTGSKSEAPREQLTKLDRGKLYFEIPNIPGATYTHIKNFTFIKWMDDDDQHGVRIMLFNGEQPDGEYHELNNSGDKWASWGWETLFEFGDFIVWSVPHSPTECVLRIFRLNYYTGDLTREVAESYTEVFFQIVKQEIQANMIVLLDNYLILNEIYCTASKQLLYRGHIYHVPCNSDRYDLVTVVGPEEYDIRKALGWVQFSNRLVNVFLDTPSVWVDGIEIADSKYVKREFGNTLETMDEYLPVYSWGGQTYLQRHSVTITHEKTLTCKCSNTTDKSVLTNWKENYRRYARSPESYSNNMIGKPEDNGCGTNYALSFMGSTEIRINNQLVSAIAGLYSIPQLTRATTASLAKNYYAYSYVMNGVHILKLVRLKEINCRVCPDNGKYPLWRTNDIDKAVYLNIENTLRDARELTYCSCEDAPAVGVPEEVPTGSGSGSYYSSGPGWDYRDEEPVDIAIVERPRTITNLVETGTSQSSYYWRQSAYRSEATDNMGDIADYTKYSSWVSEDNRLKLRYYVADLLLCNETVFYVDWASNKLIPLLYFIAIDGKTSNVQYKATNGTEVIPYVQTFSGNTSTITDDIDGIWKWQPTTPANSTVVMTFDGVFRETSDSESAEAYPVYRLLKKDNTSWVPSVNHDPNNIKSAYWHRDPSKVISARIPNDDPWWCAYNKAFTNKAEVSKPETWWTLFKSTYKEIIGNRVNIVAVYNSDDFSSTDKSGSNAAIHNKLNGARPRYLCWFEDGAWGTYTNLEGTEIVEYGDDWTGNTQSNADSDGSGVGSAYPFN